MLPRLRLLTCGSVDDGKSTLIGRLLYDADLIPDDQLDALKQASRKHGATGEEFEFALLLTFGVAAALLRYTASGRAYEIALGELFKALAVCFALGCVVYMLLGLVL